MNNHVSAVAAAAKANSAAGPPLKTAFKSKSIVSSVPSAWARSTPAQSSQPDPWCYDLPIGADYGAILSYFVGKGLPTYKFADQPAEKACVALVCYLVVLIPLPLVYLYLDNSLLPQYWYYVYWGFRGKANGIPG